MGAKVVLAMRSVALISRAMHTPVNVIVNQELEVQRVTLALRVTMDSR